jgi:hypothetical protein
MSLRNLGRTLTKFHPELTFLGMVKTLRSEIYIAMASRNTVPKQRSILTYSSMYTSMRRFLDTCTPLPARLPTLVRERGYSVQPRKRQHESSMDDTDDLESPVKRLYVSLLPEPNLLPKVII